MMSKTQFEFVEERWAPPSDVANQDELWLAGPRFGLRVSRIAKTFLSLGVAQSEAADSARQAHEAGIAVVRRSSGGSGVLLSRGDLVWSLIVPRSHPLARPPVTRAFGRLGAGIVEFLARRAISASWGGPLDLSNDFCPLGPRGSPLVVGTRVLGGAAQRLTGQALLHHGFLFTELSRSSLSDIFRLPSEILDRHLVSLNELGLASDGDENLGAAFSVLKNWLVSNELPSDPA